MQTTRSTQRRAPGTPLCVLAAVLALGLQARAAAADLVTTVTASRSLTLQQTSPCPVSDAIEVAADASGRSVKRLYLEFDLSGIPDGARIVSWTVHLSPWKRETLLGAQTAPAGPEATQRLRVFELWQPLPADAICTTQLPPAWESIKAVASANVGPGTARVELSAAAPPSREPGSTQPRLAPVLAVVVGSVSPAGTNFQYHDHDHDRASDGLDARCKGWAAGSQDLPCMNTRPRLTVRYAPARAAQPLAWPQEGADAQHSGRTPWFVATQAPGGAPAAAAPVAWPQASRHWLPAGGYISNAPVMHGDSLYFHGQARDGNVLMQMPRGGLPRATAALPGIARFSPAVDDAGRLRVVATDHSLQTIDLRRPGEPVAVFDLAALVGVRDLRVRAAPTIGRDGAIYLSTSSGLLALNPRPGLPGQASQLLLRWAVVSGRCFGGVSLSDDEARAYAVDGTTGALVVLDNVDGTELWRSPAPVRGAPRACPDDTGAEQAGASAPKLAVPVVGRGGRIYVSTGPQAPGALHVCSESAKSCLNIAGEATTAVSQAVVDADGNAYFVRSTRGDRRGPVCRYRASSGAVACSGADELHTSSVLAIDGRARLFAFDAVGEGCLQRVRAYTVGDGDATGWARVLDEAIPKQDKGVCAHDDGRDTNLRQSLLPGPDGVLYLTGATTLLRLGVHPVLPPELVINFGAGQALDDPRRNGAAYFAQDRLTLQGQVPSPASLLLRSNGDIRLGRGVAIETGARVIFQVGNQR